jgi:hypothetical protein
MRVMQAFLSMAALGGLLMSVSAPVARADDHEKCQHRIEKAEHRLDDAVRKHGERSPDAERRRHELNEEREHCWSQYHGYWNGQDHRWHDQRDWEEHHDDNH